MLTTNNVLDGSARPFDGNRDGVPGGPSRALIRRGRVSFYPGS